MVVTKWTTVRSAASAEEHLAPGIDGDGGEQPGLGERVGGEKCLDLCAVLRIVDDQAADGRGRVVGEHRASGQQLGGVAVEMLQVGRAVFRADGAATRLV